MQASVRDIFDLPFEILGTITPHFGFRYDNHKPKFVPETRRGCVAEATVSRHRVRPRRGVAGSGKTEEDRSPDARTLRRRWAEMIKRVYEVDPLVCPRCHSEMSIIAFIV